MLPCLLLAAGLLPTARAQYSQQGNKLVASDAIGLAAQGGAVAISANGNTAIFGGSSDNNGVGAAWVYTRTSGAWSEQAKLTPSDAVGSPGFGTSVALSGDGNTAFIGGPMDNGHTGASWVFVRSGAVWTEQAKLTAQPEAASTCSSCHGNSVTAAPYNPLQQGNAVGLSADGNTAIAGSMMDHHARGSVWIYTRSGAVWTQTPGVLSAGEAGGMALLGRSVALSGDGTTAMAGAGAGAVWAYILSNGSWSQQGTALQPSDSVEPSDFGVSVALSADGNTGLIGGDYDNEYAGASWVFTRASGVWTQQGSKLAGSDATGVGQDFPYTFQGFSVSLSADGDTAIVGGYGDGVTESIGAIWEYKRLNGAWVQLGNKLIGRGAANGANGSQQGCAVAISGDGTTVISGGNYDSNSGPAWNISSAGAVWIFTYVPPPLVQQGNKITGTGLPSGSGTDPQFGYSVAVSADGNTIIAGTFSANKAEIYARANGIWTQQAAYSGGQYYGWAVAISADGNTAVVGAPYDYGPNGYGVAYVYTRTNGVWTQQGTLSGSGAGTYPAPMKGRAVAISADGNTVMVGGPSDGNMGAVWVFTRSGVTWTQQGGKMVATGGVAPESQGASVALSADGNTALVGDNAENGARGTLWVWRRDANGNWTQQAKLAVAGAIAYEELGTSIGLSADGNTAISGTNSNYLYNSGAFVFMRSNGVWSAGNPLTATGWDASSAALAEVGAAVAISPDGNTALVGGPGDNSGVGATWMFTRSGGVWTQLGGKMVGTGVGGWGACQGDAVAISGDAHTAIVAGYRDNNDQGALWVFSSWPAPASLRVTAPGSAAKGASFPFGVTAIDSSGNPVGNYTGPVQFTSGDAAAGLPAESPLNYGAGTFTATLNTAGAQTVTATDANKPSLTGTSNSIAVTGAGVATHFTIAAPPAATAGASFTLIVTAVDAANNTVTGYAHTVHFTSTDSAAGLPSDAALADGTGTFTATLQTLGRQSLTATDTTVPTVTGKSGAIVVSAALPATHFVVSAASFVGSRRGLQLYSDGYGRQRQYGGGIHVARCTSAAATARRRCRRMPP